jgi:hypothetical protein
MTDFIFIKNTGNQPPSPTPPKKKKLKNLKTQVYLSNEINQCYLISYNQKQMWLLQAEQSSIQ